MHSRDTLETVRARVAGGQAVLVDVREQDEWDAEHIATAIHLPLSELQQCVLAGALGDRLPADKVLYTHCAAGVRSVMAAEVLGQLGFSVQALEPGLAELVSAGFEPASQSKGR